RIVGEAARQRGHAETPLRAAFLPLPKGERSILAEGVDRLRGLRCKCVTEAKSPSPHPSPLRGGGAAGGPLATNCHGLALDGNVTVRLDGPARLADVVGGPLAPRARPPG